MHNHTGTHTRIHVRKHALAFALMCIPALGHAHTHSFTHIDTPPHVHLHAQVGMGREQEGSWSTCPREGSAPVEWKGQCLHFGPSQSSNWAVTDL